MLVTKLRVRQSVYGRCTVYVVVVTVVVHSTCWAIYYILLRAYVRVQNSSRLSAVAGTLTTLASYFSPKKYKISCLDWSTEISCCKLKETFYIRQ